MDTEPREAQSLTSVTQLSQPKSTLSPNRPCPRPGLVKWEGGGGSYLMTHQPSKSL